MSEKVRLSSEQISVFHKVISDFLKNDKYELYLFGSRTDLTLKGGDIDLLILTSQNGIKKFSKYYLDILVQIKKNNSIGQRRIDIKACDEIELNINPFLKTIKSNLVKI